MFCDRRQAEAVRNYHNLQAMMICLLQELSVQALMLKKAS
jgi:hypothetical protein